MAHAWQREWDDASVGKRAGLRTREKQSRTTHEWGSGTTDEWRASGMAHAWEESGRRKRGKQSRTTHE